MHSPEFIDKKFIISGAITPSFAATSAAPAVRFHRQGNLIRHDLTTDKSVSRRHMSEALERLAAQYPLRKVRDKLGEIDILSHFLVILPFLSNEKCKIKS
jgi:hypothetical protein